MKRVLSLLAALCVSSLSFSHAESLGDLVTQHGFDWIIGNWKNEGTSERQVALTYEWRLDRHAIGVKAKAHDREYEGLIARDPKSGDVGYVAVDNKGGGAIGKWTADDGKLVLKLNYKKEDGESGKMAMVHEKKDDKTIKLSMHSMSEDGELGELRYEIELKRS